MDAAIAPEGHAMNIANSVLPHLSPTAFIKGIGGCAFITLCFAGAITTGLKLPFGPTAQFLATAAGAIAGGILTWYVGRPSA
jgi:hypothetical protein